MNRFTSGLPPKKIKVLRPDMKFRKRTPIFLRKHDLRRRNLHPVSVFFIFFDVNPADVNPVRKHSILTRKFPFSVKCLYKLCKVVRSTFIFKEGSIFLFFQVKIEKGAHDQNADIRYNCSNLAMNGESRAATLCPPLNCESSYRTISRDIISGFAVYSPSILANFQCPL